MLLHQKILLHAFIVLIVVAVSHGLALTFYFYWQLWWFDTVVHFLGGMVVGFGTLWALTGVAHYREISFSRVRALLLVLCSVVVVAISWELFEFHFGLFDSANYGSDTSADLLAGVLGATVAYAYVMHLVEREM